MGTQCSEGTSETGASVKHRRVRARMAPERRGGAAMTSQHCAVCGAKATARVSSSPAHAHSCRGVCVCVCR